jgi:tetratricopeptide (TPR) repeat protein
LINEANSNALNSGVQTVPTNIFVQSLIQNSIPSSDAVSIENSPLFIDSSSGPMKTLQTKILSSSKKLKNEGQVGREVLIQTLKTVDYRVYRKENTVIVDGNSLLNGVSANQSNQSSSTENLERKEIAYFDFLTETMRFFNKGMIDLATENFDLILETFPDDVNALFYSGLCALENKDFRKSISFFESVRIHNFTNFREEAEWKLMNVYMLEKELSKAKSLRDEIIQKNGFYAKQAKSIEL